MTTTIEKQLVTKQDLALGAGKVVQRRNGVNLTLDKVYFAQEFNSLASALTSDTLNAGETIELTEFAAGKGGRGTWDIVLASSVTLDGVTRIQLTAQPTLAMVLRPVNDEIWLDQVGADSAVDNSPELLEAFVQRCTDDNLTGRIKFPGYVFDFTGHTAAQAYAISRLVGDRDLNGQKCRINIKEIANTNFTCGDNVYLDGITFYSRDVDPTTKTLIESYTPIFQVELGDVTFKWDSGVTTGVTRAKGFLRCQPKNFKFNTLVGIGVETFITIDSKPSQPCDKLQGGVLYVENFGTGLFCNGEPFTSGATQEAGWFKDINIQYIAGRNTPTQQLNWFNKAGDPVPNGKDILLVAGYRRLHVGFVDSERAIERALYANTGTGPTTIGNYQLEYSSGIKVVGLVVFDQGIEVINRNINIGIGSSKGGAPSTQDSFGRAVTLYDVEHVVVDTINIQGFEDGANRYLSEGVLLQNYCKNVHIKGVKGQLTRSAPVVIDQKPNAGKDSYMENINIENISMWNPSNSAPRALVHFLRDPSMAPAYSMKNLRLVGNYGKSTTKFGINYDDFDSSSYAEDSRLLGIIDCDWIDGLTLRDNHIEGYRFLEGPLRIGPNCSRVKVTENIEVTTTDFLIDAQSDTTWPGPFYNLSNGSEVDFKMLESARNGFLYAKVLPVAAGGNSDLTQSLMYDSAIELTFSVKVPPGVTYSLPIVNGVQNCITGTILEPANGAFLDFRYDVSGLTDKDSNAFETTPTGTTVSRFYDDGFGNMVLKNDTTGDRRYTAKLTLSRTTS